MAHMLRSAVTYSEPLSRVHSISALSQLSEGHGGIWWNLLMLIAGKEIESPSARDWSKRKGGDG